jgi:hypothetical protein
MTFGRLTWGIMAGTAGTVSVLVVQWMWTRVFGEFTHVSLWWVFVGAGGAVLLAADYLGLMASPYTEPTPSLDARASSEYKRDDRP